MLSRTAICISHRALSCGNVVSQRIMYRSMHLTCRIRNTSITNRTVLKISKYSPALGSYSKRYSSTVEAANVLVNETVAAAPAGNPVTETLTQTPVAEGFTGQDVAEGLSPKFLENIPDAPIPPTVLDTVASLGEPSLAELGLGGWMPPGIVQQCLEILHVSCGLPWWETIAIGTLVIRCLLFPVVIMAQRNGAKMHNIMPQLTKIQQDMSEARLSGDQFKAARKTAEMMAFMRENDCNPLKNMLIPLAQAPVFLSVFMALRKMTALPVESMKEGGLWWFADLTIPDPYYLLPLMTAATLSITIEIGADSARAASMGMMRYVLRAIPVVILPFTINFPAAILCYWASSNFISLLQVGVLRIPKVRAFFNIDPLKNHSPSEIPPNKGFVKGLKESMSNMKTAREMNSRYHVDAIQFQRAGRGPLQPTFASDPTRIITKKSQKVSAKRG